MAKKSNKPTREQVYREIMEKEGRKWDDCKVLAFAFKQERRPELFHFGLMLHEPRPVYYLFDCWDKYANVVVPKDEQNAAELVRIIAGRGGEIRLFPEPVRYVEGYAYAYGLLPIEHAFVKIGDKYIDPTFERALHRDVRKEMYASCIELDPLTMANYQLETGYFGELYVYDYMCKNRPELAAQIRARNPHNRR